MILLVTNLSAGKWNPQADINEVEASAESCLPCRGIIRKGNDEKT